MDFYGLLIGVLVSYGVLLRVDFGTGRTQLEHMFT